MNYLAQHFWNLETNCIDGLKLWNALQPHIAKGELIVNEGKGERQGLKLVTYSKTYQYEHNAVAWDPLVQHCRGIIFDASDTLSPYRIVALPFSKFFNYGEGGIHYPAAGAEIEQIWTKYDGCCHEDMILCTEDGKKTIKEIVDTKYSGKVLSFNHENQTTEYNNIVGHSVMSNNNDWYEIELDTGELLKLTGNHKIWCVNLNAYRAVRDLQGDEIFLLKG